MKAPKQISMAQSSEKHLQAPCHLITLLTWIFGENTSPLSYTHKANVLPMFINIQCHSFKMLGCPCLHPFLVSYHPHGVVKRPHSTLGNPFPLIHMPNQWLFLLTSLVEPVLSSHPSLPMVTLHRCISNKGFFHVVQNPNRAKSEKPCRTEYALVKESSLIMTVAVSPDSGVKL